MLNHLIRSALFLRKGPLRGVVIVPSPTAGTYDPRYDSSYWTHITLGLPAGMMLANLIPISAGEEPLTMPLLALVGGFSATLVHRVLAKLVNMVDSLFSVGSRENAALTTKATRATATQNMETVTALLALQEQVSAGAPPEQLSQSIGTVIRDLAPKTQK